MIQAFRILTLCLLVTLLHACGQSIDEASFSSKLTHNQFLLERIGADIWSSSEAALIDIRDLHGKEPALDGLVTIPPSLKNKLNHSEWHQLKRANIAYITADKDLGGVLFVLSTTGIAISGTATGYLLVFETVPKEYQVRSINPAIEAKLRAGQNKFRLVKPLDSKWAIFYDRY
ncbi:MAG TPA: hypothetical protein VFV57_03185 [Limnobacter sp.]|nr:hypothetical protein [Limnobacter sp.]